MKASILAIGTELTTGQIHNRNAQWLSAKLIGFGLETSFHLVVPDERQLIDDALKYLSERSDFVFVTGGLGPTSDDFTRDCIGKFAGLAMEYDQESWQHLSQRLTGRGIAVGEMQKQQCYFPKGSVILKNRTGTANAFRLRHQKTELVILPGPPAEIEAVWQDHLHSWLQSKTQNLDPLLTFSWDLLGLPESEVAQKAESVLGNDTLTRAYRVHLPYVEFKLSFLKSQLALAQNFEKKLDQAFGAFCVARNFSDPAEQLALLLENLNGPISIVDSVTNGFLLQRLLPFCKTLLGKNKISFLQSLPEQGDGTFLWLRADGSRQAVAELFLQGQKRSQYLSSIYRSENMLERERQFFAESALLFWQKELKS